MSLEPNTQLKAHEKTIQEIKLWSQAIDKRLAEFDDWITETKARLDAIERKIELAKNKKK